MFKFFLLLTIFSPIAVAQQPDSTLQFVQIWFRHGERLPTHFLNLPGDPVPSRYLEIGEPGELTNKGIMEEYELGMALRRYYGEYFDGYHPSDIYVWTGEDNRTVDSAQAVGAGLFPPSADGTWNPDLKWHPFSTHTDASIDWVSTGIQGVCPVYEVSFFSQPEYLAISKQLANQDTIEIAKKSMPMVDIEDPRDINHLFDSLYIRSILNDSRLPFPTWAEPIKDKIRVIMSDIHYRITDLQTPIIDYHREKILAFMEDHLQRKTKNKGVFMSAHDTNMMLLGKAFDISEMKYQLPFFGGHFAVELHNSNSTYYVKFFYSSSFDKPMTEVKPSYCQGKTCTLAELQSNTKDSRITSDEMLKLCRGVSSVREQPILTDILHLLSLATAMKEYLELMVLSIHYFTSLAGLFMNIYLLYLIIRHTPSVLRTYSVLVLNACLTDTFACLSSCLTITRIVPSGISLTYIFHGACTLVGSTFCYYSYCFMLHSLAHSLFVILASFVYRNYVITKPQISTSFLSVCAAILYIPSFIQFFTFCLDMGDEQTIRATILTSHPTYNITGLVVAGNESVFAPLCLGTILYMTAPCVPVYIGIAILRTNIYRQLSEKSKHFSANTIKTHKQLARALTIHACLPIFFILADPLIESMVFFWINFIPFFAPMVSIYFIRPYKERTLRYMGKHVPTSAPISTMSFRA